LLAVIDCFFYFTSFNGAYLLSFVLETPMLPGIASLFATKRLFPKLQVRNERLSYFAIMSGASQKLNCNILRTKKLQKINIASIFRGLVRNGNVFWLTK